jgi:Tol biopolymer transport system component
LARLTGDQLTMFWASRQDVWIAKRSRISDDFSSAIPVPVINSAGIDVSPAVTADGLNLFFESYRGVAGGRLYSTTRASAASDFSPPMVIPNIGATNPNASDVQPYVTPDGTTLYFASDRGNGRYDLFRATRSTDAGQFEAAKPIGSLNSAFDEIVPVVSSDELTIYFGSDRNAPGARGFDIYMARRASKDAEFGDVTPVTELNSGNSEFPNWISPDGCTIYLHRWLPDDDIYVARRPR